MKPFNLEEALAGKPVVTRDGEEVTQLHKFDISSKYNVCGVVDGTLRSFTSKGLYSLVVGETGTDLFMKEEETTLWINVYLREEYFYIGGSYLSKKEAAEIGSRQGDYAGTFPLVVKY